MSWSAKQEDLARLWRFARKSWPARASWWVLVGAVFALGHTVGQMSLPLVLGFIVDEALIEESRQMLAQGAILLLVVAAASIGFRSLHRVVFVKLREGSLKRLRQVLFEHLQALPSSYLDRNASGRNHALLMEDAGKFSKVFNPVLAVVVLATIKLVGIIGFIAFKFGALVFVVLLLIPIYVVWPALFARRVRKASRRAMKAQEHVSAALQESIQAIREIKLFGRESWAVGRLVPLLRRKESREVKKAYLQGVHSLSNVLYFCVGALVYWFGGLQVIQGQWSVGELIALVGLLGLLEGPVGQLVSLNVDVQSVLASSERLRPMLEAEREASGTLRLPQRSAHSIRFTDVHFTYPGSASPALDGLDFEVAQGETIAIVGPSGGGKSTTIALLARLYEPDFGRIQIDGEDIQSYDVRALRARLGVVPQDWTLFATTVEQNIRFGRLDATDAEVEAAARAAHALDFIEDLPQGFDTEIGEQGSKLSRGQRQRLVIARVILRDPGIVILDEATSSLDSESDWIVRRALEEATRGRTSLVIAHRLSTITRSDRILFMQEGRILAEGAHRELLETSERYHRFHELQSISHRDETAPGATEV